MSLKAIIIDDEKPARLVLKNLLETYGDGTEVLGCYENLPSGIIAINKFQPDVVFLDIEMPDYSGFSIVDFFDQIDFKIVFVTAYNKYAIQAFEISAFDYILKPVKISQLERVIKKIQNSILPLNKLALSNLKDVMFNVGESKIAVPVSKGLEILNIADILLIDADGSYSLITMLDGTTKLISKRLQHFVNHDALQSSFYRIHRSHFINLKHLISYNKQESNVLMANGITRNISRNSKSDFELALRSF